MSLLLDGQHMGKICDSTQNSYPCYKQLWRGMSSKALLGTWPNSLLVALSAAEVEVGKHITIDCNRIGFTCQWDSCQCLQ